MSHVSSTKTPHYSHIVHAINNAGGLKLYFARSGRQGDGWERHLASIVADNNVILHEHHPVTATDDHHSTPLHNALRNQAAKHSTVVLPAGYYGEQLAHNESVPGFQPHELLTLMPESSKHITDGIVQRYQALQSVREMRGAVGSLAWLAAHCNTRSHQLAEQPVVLWGRTHSVSLPDMYSRLGVRLGEVKELDSPLRYSYLQPHGSQWSEHAIEAAFEHAYKLAHDFFTTRSTTAA